MNIVQLKELNQEELNLLEKMPVLITLLIGYADENLNEKEKEMGKISAEFRKTGGDTLVQDYFAWVSPAYDAHLEAAIRQYGALSAEERLDAISAEIERANKILNKIDTKYASALLESWRGLARAVAQSSGGILGRMAVTYEERDLMALDMLYLE